MPSYWEQRAVNSIGRMEKAVNGQIPDLVKSFEQARKGLNDKVFYFYTRYAVNNKITLGEAQQALSLSELKDFRDSLEEFEQLAKDSIGTFNLQVDNLSVKARVTRYEALLTQCDGVLQKLYQEQKKQIEGTATDVYTSEYYHSLFDIEQYTGFKFNYSQPAASAVQKVIEQPVQGMDISEHLWRQDIDTGFKIRQTLNNMFVTGRPPQDFADQLQKQIGAVRVNADGNVTGTGKKYEAYRLLYNESAHATGQANLQAYEDDGIDEYEIVAALDRTTCDTCGSLDGKHFPRDKAVEGVNYPPIHCNCRCVAAPYVDTGFSSSRMARDPVTGANVSTEAQTYDEWKTQQDKLHGAGTVERERKKAQNESSDFQQYQGIKSVLKENAPKSFAEFQNLKYNKSEEWERTKGFYQYKAKHPTAGIEYYDIYHELQTLGIKKGVVLPPGKVSSYILEDSAAKDPAHIMKRMKERHITDDDVHDYVNNALVMFDQWKGTRKAFYSSEGVTVVTKHDDGWIAKTAMGKSDFDEDAEKILEVVKKYVK